MYRAKGPFLARHRSFTCNVALLLASIFHSSHQCKLRSERAVCYAKGNIGFRLFAAGLGPQACSPSVEHEIPIPFFARSLMFAKANIGFRSMPGFHAPIAKTISMINAWYKGKDIRKNVLVPHADKLLHHTEECVISNNAINMHSRGPTEQHFCALEPHRGCLHKVKKVCSYPLLKRGQRNHKYAF